MHLFRTFERNRLRWAVDNHLKWMLHYQERLEAARRNVYVDYDGNRRYISTMREKISWVRFFKERFKRERDLFNYESIKLGRLLFGPDYHS